MPIGRKLDVGPVVLDLQIMQAWFKLEGSTCEAPECQANPQPAFCWYQTDYSFVWLCQPHYEMTMLMDETTQARWNRKLAEHMYELFLVRSYVHQNNKSGFALEQSIEVARQAAYEIAQMETSARAVETRQIRAAIKSAPHRIGSPDEELLTARQRQAARTAQGKPTLGPSIQQRTDRLVTLRAKLTVPTAKIINQSPPLPAQATQENQ